MEVKTTDCEGVTRDLRYNLKYDEISGKPTQSKHEAKRSGSLEDDDTKSDWLWPEGWTAVQKTANLSKKSPDWVWYPKRITNVDSIEWQESLTNDNLKKVKLED